MIRRYDPDRPVPAEIRDRILTNALRAPSAGFSQGWAFLVLETPADRRRFWTATSPAGGSPDGEMSRWLASMITAPLIIVPLSHKRAYLDRYAEPDKGWTDRDEARWPVPYWDIDTGFAALLMLLTAVDEDLGACFFGITPDRFPAFHAEFGVPDEYTPIGAISVGYRAPDDIRGSRARGRRPIEDVVHFGQW